MTANPIRVAVSGAAGRMGRMLVSAVTRTDAMRVTGAVDHPDTSAQGVDAGELAGAGRLGVPIVGNIAEMADFDVLVDFSVATATLDKLGFCGDNGKALVIGTTGFAAAGLEAIRRAADSVPIVMAPNMSVGVNVAFKLIEFAARALGNDVDVEVFEAATRSTPPPEPRYAWARSWPTRWAASPPMPLRSRGHHRNATAPSASTACDIVGEHTVTFAGTGERIEAIRRAADSVDRASSWPPTSAYPQRRCQRRLQADRIRRAGTRRRCRCRGVRGSPPPQDCDAGPPELSRRDRMRDLAKTCSA